MAARFIGSSFAAAAVFLMPVFAFAHTGLGDTSGFSHGFGHPLSGLDHILAMVMVGVLAQQLSGPSLWLVPMTFVAVMAAGGALGVLGFGVPFVEVGIALSVVVLGAIVAFDVKPSIAGAMGVVGLFAIFHGHAHGTEMPKETGGAAYAAGFMIATGLLHLTGIGAGLMIGKTSARLGWFVMRSAGGLATVAGIGVLIGIL